MKKYLCTLFLLLLISCSQIRYLRKPICDYPNIELNHRILIAENRNLDNKSFRSDVCLDGLVSSLEKSSIHIIDRLDFHQKVDFFILNELKTRYNADGLLLLKEITANSNEDIIQTLSHACVGCPLNYKVELYTEVVTYWEYFDFISGNTYVYGVTNNKDETTRYQDNNIEAYLNYKLKTIEMLLFDHGGISLNKLTGL